MAHQLSKFDIWSSNTLMVHGSVSVVGRPELWAKNVKACSFEEACEKYFGGSPNFNREKMTFYGDRLSPDYPM